MQQHKIEIDVTLDNLKMPEHIEWHASNGGHGDTPQAAKAMLLSLWDGKEKAAMRIDLWTKLMTIDEMNTFFFQTMVTLADTYANATKNKGLGDDFKNFAKEFKAKADELLRSEFDQMEAELKKAEETAQNNANENESL